MFSTKYIRRNDDSYFGQLTSFSDAIVCNSWLRCLLGFSILCNVWYGSKKILLVHIVRTLIFSIHQVFPQQKVIRKDTWKYLDISTGFAFEVLSFIPAKHCWEKADFNIHFHYGQLASGFEIKQMCLIAKWCTAAFDWGAIF